MASHAIIDVIVYKKEILGTYVLSAQFTKVVCHYHQIGFNIDVLLTVCLVVNPITIGGLLSSLTVCRRVGLRTL